MKVKDLVKILATVDPNTEIVLPTPPGRDLDYVSLNVLKIQQVRIAKADNSAGLGFYERPWGLPGIVLR